jgi:hypothetical protein
LLAGSLAGIALTLFQVAVARYAMRSTIAARSEWPIAVGMVLISVPIVILASFEVKSGTITSSVHFELQSPAGFLAASAYLILIMSLFTSALWGLLLAIVIIMLTALSGRWPTGFYMQPAVIGLRKTSYFCIPSQCH